MMRACEVGKGLVWFKTMYMEQVLYEDLNIYVSLEYLVRIIYFSRHFFGKLRGQ